MLEQVSARDLSEWMAYEQVAGPIDDSWRDEILAQIHEVMQMNGQLIGMTVNRKKGSKNPAPKFRSVPRPRDVFKKEDEGEEGEEIDDEEADAPAFGDKRRR